MSESLDASGELLTKPLIIINIGLDSFAQNLVDQGVDVTRVEWKPPAGGDKEMIALLDQLL
jgi:hypothetical protein